MPRPPLTASMPCQAPQTRAQLEQALGLQMVAFVAGARSGVHPQVLAHHLDDIIDTTCQLSGTRLEDAARLDDEDGSEAASLARVVRALDRTRVTLKCMDKAPPTTRHALDPLLVAVLRGDFAQH